MLVLHILSSVSQIKSFLSVIFYDDCEDTCTLSYYHHYIGSMIVWEQWYELYILLYSFQLKDLERVITFLRHRDIIQERLRL